MEMNVLYEKITKKAWEDEAFKQRLLSDPKAAVREAAGIEIPASVKVSVHETKPEHWCFVLPPNPNQAAAELSDSELDQVAGGASDGKGSTISPYVPIGIGVVEEPVIIPKIQVDPGSFQR